MRACRAMRPCRRWNAADRTGSATDERQPEFPADPAEPCPQTASGRAGGGGRPFYALLATPAGAQSINPKQLRIGYQKYGTLTLLKARGTLEQRLAPLGIGVKWTEFPAGPQLLEGLNVGSIDFGTVGEAPPIFAQAAGAQLAYIGNEPPAPAAEAIVVSRNSAIQRVADLRGKRVALNKGSNVHYLLVRLLERRACPTAKSSRSTRRPMRAAFERGAVDAWVIWDPFTAAAQVQLNARVLADGRNVVSNHQFYGIAGLCASAARCGQADLDELAALGAGRKRTPGRVFGADHRTRSRTRGGGLAVARFAYGAKPVTPEVLAEQQRIADVFHGLKLIPKAIRSLTPAGAGAALMAPATTA